MLLDGCIYLCGLQQTFRKFGQITSDKGKTVLQFSHVLKTSKSVVGLSIDFVILHMLGHIYYAIFNVALFYVPLVKVGDSRTNYANILLVVQFLGTIWETFSKKRKTCCVQRRGVFNNCCPPGFYYFHSVACIRERPATCFQNHKDLFDFLFLRSGINTDSYTVECAGMA